MEPFQRLSSRNVDPHVCICVCFSLEWEKMQQVETETGPLRGHSNGCGSSSFVYYLCTLTVWVPIPLRLHIFVLLSGLSAHTHVELPFYSKFLLIAAYLASYNPARTDKRFFVKVRW